MHLKYRNLILLSLLLILSRTWLPGQKASFREFTVRDGLPQSQVHNIVQDSRGYLWISTKNGLSRFDGIEFVNYFRKDGLPDNRVMSVFEDTCSHLWAWSVNGLSVYTGRGFYYFPLPPEYEKWLFSYPPSVDGFNNILLLGKSPEDTLLRLVTFSDGIYSDFSKNWPALDTLKIKEFGIDLQSYDMLIIDQKNFLWIWKDSTIYQGSLKNVRHLFRDHGKLLLNSGNTIYSYSDGKFEPYRFPDQSQKYGVNRYPSSHDRRIEIFDGRERYFIELPFNYMSFTLDDENVLWFSTEGNMHRLMSDAFTSFSNNEITTGNLWTIAEDRNGHIFFGTLSNTLIEFDGKKFRQRNDFRQLYKRHISFYKGSRRMSDGDIWFSTDAGVLIWDGNSFSRLKGLPDDIQICYIYEDPDSKTVMLGTGKGLAIIRNDNVRLLTEFTSAGYGVIEGITRGDYGNYWLSGHKGIIRFDGNNSFPVKEDILPVEFTYTLVKDRSGGLWVTSENGLYFRNKTADHFVHGLPEGINQPANSIMVIDADHILVGRINDICIIDLEKFYGDENDYFRIYDETDGFTGGDCLDNGLIKDRSGRIWILTSDKTVILDPQRLIKNPTPPRLNITGVSYETDDLTWEPVDSSGFFYGLPDFIKLKNYQNKIQISFNGISTINPEKVKYQYRLEGFDDRWSLPSGKRFVEYEKLPPGHYNFQLKAANADGVETSRPLEFGIILTPTLWQRTVFKIIVCIFGVFFTICFTLLYIRRRLRRREEEALLRSELSKLQMSSVLKQFDPHFTFNVISAIGSLIMKGEKENAYDYITILAGLLRSVLNEGSVIIKPLSEEIDFVKKYCELQKLRFRDRISFSVRVDEGVDLQKQIPKMTIQLFVENAIKHGLDDRKEGGKVDIAVARNNNSLEIRITDNGIGLNAAARKSKDGPGNGIKMINGLFEMMNSFNTSVSTIEVADIEENGAVSGTRVRILIPDDYQFEFRKVSKD